MMIGSNNEYIGPDPGFDSILEGEVLAPDVFDTDAQNPTEEPPIVIEGEVLDESEIPTVAYDEPQHRSAYPRRRRIIVGMTIAAIGVTSGGSWIVSALNNDGRDEDFSAADSNPISIHQPTAAQSIKILLPVVDETTPTEDSIPNSTVLIPPLPTSSSTKIMQEPTKTPTPIEVTATATVPNVPVLPTHTPGDVPAPVESAIPSPTANTSTPSDTMPTQPSSETVPVSSTPTVVITTSQSEFAQEAFQRWWSWRHHDGREDDHEAAMNDFTQELAKRLQANGIAVIIDSDQAVQNSLVVKLDSGQNQVIYNARHHEFMQDGADAKKDAADACTAAQVASDTQANWQRSVDQTVGGPTKHVPFLNTMIPDGPSLTLKVDIDGSGPAAEQQEGLDATATSVGSALTTALGNWTTIVEQCAQ